MVHLARRVFLGLVILLSGCAAPIPLAVHVRLDSLLPADAILLGEQHDAAQHQRIHRDLIADLADRGLLAGVVIEMAEQGNATASLDRNATEEQVRQALQWRESEWAWADYGPAVMAAVRHGAPVWGANLPRARMASAMANAQLDRLLSGPALKAQQQLIRSGHCDLLPESQITPMTRIQIARDVAMAQTLTSALRAGKTVVLLAGSVHVDRQLGVPQHLASAVQAKSLLLFAQKTVSTTQDNSEHFEQIWRTDPLAAKDYCAVFKAQSEGRPSSP